MTGHKHRSNCELVAQGLGNIGSVLFGGIPATGAIARTSANIRLGAKTPFSGMIHAATLLLMCLCPDGWKNPLAALSGILIFVAWNMSELPHFIGILKGQKGDAIVLLITFLLTVLIDLAVAVQVGVVLAALIFMKKMTDTTTVAASQLVVKEDTDEHPEPTALEMPGIQDIPPDVVVFEIRGPFFYSVADLLDEALTQLEVKPRVFILRLDKTPLIDATGLSALKKFEAKCRQKGIVFLISDVDKEKEALLKESGLTTPLFEDLESALQFIV